MHKIKSLLEFLQKKAAVHEEKLNPEARNHKDHTSVL